MQTGKAGGGGTPMNKGGFASALVRLNHITHRIVLFIAQASILAMVAIVTLTVILRYCFNTGLSWAEEVPRLLVTVFAFIACAIGVRDHMHVAVNARYKLTPEDGEAGWQLLEAAAKKRGFLAGRGEYDTERMSAVLLDEFRGGKLGRMSLEAPDEG